MMERIEVKVLLLFVLVFLAITLYAGARVASEYVGQIDTSNEGQNIVRRTVVPAKIGSKSFLLEIVDTPELREKGLSNREPSCNNCGMIFVFDKAGIYSIWMKNMLFPIDVFWLNERKQIIHVVKNMTPESYPQTFSPGSPSKYIIELPAGSGVEEELEIGDKIDLVLPN